MSLNICSPATEKKVALVTGACGFMGSHLIQLLADCGRYGLVLATDIVSPKLELPYDAFFLADLAARNGAQNLLVNMHGELLRRKCTDQLYDGERFHVFDVKGLFDYSRTYPELHRANVTASQNLYEALLWKRFRSRLIVWSAAGIYGDFPENPAKENSPEIPAGNYLTSKWVQEKLALEYGRRNPSHLSVAAIRPAGVYGPRSRYGVATSIKLMARGMMGPFRMGRGKNRVSTIHVRDVCGAAMHLANLGWEQVSGQVYNVADESAYTIAEISKFLGRELGFSFAPGIWLPFGIMEKMTADLMKKAKKKGRISMVDNEMSALLKLDALLDISKIKATGWVQKYPDALAGLKETIASYREEGWI